MLSTTTFELPGFRIVTCLGLVRGITVRTRSLPVTIVGGLRTLFGGRAGIFTTLCESAREEAFQLLSLLGIYSALGWPLSLLVAFLINRPARDERTAR